MTTLTAKGSPLAATFVLLIEGYVSVSTQMIALRQAVPFVGSSITSTSIIITVFLGALAFGYHSGGRRSVKSRNRVVGNLVASAILLGFCLSYFVVETFFMAAFANGIHPLIAVFAYALVLVAPIVFLLAETVVVLVEQRETGDASQKAGDTFLVSTLGNVVGGLVSTLVVMYLFGVGAAITLSIALLILSSLVWMEPGRSMRRNAPIYSSMGLAAIFSIVLVLQSESVAFDRTTAFGNYAVREVGDDRVFFNNGQNASKSNDQGVGHAYIEHFESVVDAIGLDAEILVLGAGGFTLGDGKSYSDVRFVDIDPAIGDFGLELLDKTELPGEFIVADARAYLLSSPRKADVIVVDTFSHRSSVPAHLLTDAFFGLVKGALNRDGVVLMNFIASDKDRVFRRTLDNTIRSVFADCWQSRMRTDGLEAYNLTYACYSSDVDSIDSVYTDSSTRAAVDSAIY